MFGPHTSQLDNNVAAVNIEIEIIDILILNVLFIAFG
jgi:hypothetical protein